MSDGPWSGPDARSAGERLGEEPRGARRAEELDEGDPFELAGPVPRPRRSLPNLTVVSGCCGTDDRPASAPSAPPGPGSGCRHERRGAAGIPSPTWPPSAATAWCSRRARASASGTRAGNRYLDGSASLWYCNIGHGRTEIADAVAEQLRTREPIRSPARSRSRAPLKWRRSWRPFTDGRSEGAAAAGRRRRRDRHRGEVRHGSTGRRSGSRSVSSLSRGAVRVSLGWTTTDRDLEMLLNAWKRVVSSLLKGRATEGCLKQPFKGTCATKDAKRP